MENEHAKITEIIASRKRIDLKKKTPLTEREVSGRLFERVFLPWTAILILSHLVTMYVAPAYTWGVHFYHFFPSWYS